MNTKSKFLLILFVLLTSALSACGGKAKIKFVAPEIDPPADLIPAHVPEGFKLIQGFRITVDGVKARLFFDDPEDCGEGSCVHRLVCRLDLTDIISGLKSPSGNDILGVYYRAGEHLLLITKSYFPGGSLDLWRTYLEGDQDHITQDSNRDCDCASECPCVIIADVPLPFPLRHAEIEKVITVGETQVAVVNQALLGTTAVFVRGDSLLTVESDIPLEEILQIVESLLK